MVVTRRLEGDFGGGLYYLDRLYLDLSSSTTVMGSAKDFSYD